MPKFKKSKIRLIHGDCLKEIHKLDRSSVDLVLTDPPYGTTACKWDSIIPFEPMWEGIEGVIKERAAVVLFGSQPFTSALVMSNSKWFKYEWIWEKEQGSMMLNAPYQPIKVHENVLVFSKSASTYSPRGVMSYNPQMTVGVPYKSSARKSGSMVFHSNPDTKPKKNHGTRYPRTVQKFKTNRGMHPTQKPVALMEYLIKTYTNEGETVLDFAMGSGTTGVACVNTGRKFIGIEKDENYFNTAKERIANG